MADLAQLEGRDAHQPETPVDLGDDRWLLDSEESCPMPDPDDEIWTVERGWLFSPIDAREVSQEVRDSWFHSTGMSLEDYLRNVFAGASCWVGEVSLAAELNDLSLHSVRLQAQICSSPAGHPIGEWDEIFSFSPFGTDVELLKIDLEDEEAGQGQGQELWASAISTYQEMGISAVRVWGDGERRGFALPHYGVKPAGARQTGELFASLRKKVSGLQLSRDLAAKIYQILGRSEPEAIWDLVDLRETWVNPEGVAIPVGQALLAGELWPGILDLTDQRAMARANRFFDPALTKRERRSPAIEQILDGGRTRIPQESIADLRETGLTLEQTLQLLNISAPCSQGEAAQRPKQTR